MSHHTLPILVVIAIVLVEMATDLYAPNMPSMMDYFGVSIKQLAK